MAMDTAKTDSWAYGSATPWARLSGESSSEVDYRTWIPGLGEEAEQWLIERLEELSVEALADDECDAPTEAAKQRLRLRLPQLIEAWFRSQASRLPLPFVTVEWDGTVRCEWDTSAHHLVWFFEPDGRERLHLLRFQDGRASTRFLIPQPTTAQIISLLVESEIPALS